jgi:pantothenate kinase
MEPIYDEMARKISELKEKCDPENQLLIGIAGPPGVGQSY